MRSSDFRLICATNHNLQGGIENGAFRKDLYYRICVFPVHIPPLRERKEDLPGLAKHILAGFGYDHFPLSGEVEEVLSSYAWPGNVRELRNMVERAILLSKSMPVSPVHFPGLDPSQKVPQSAAGSEIWNLEEAESTHIRRVLDLCDGDKNKAAERLGISLSSLYRKLGKAPQHA